MSLINPHLPAADGIYSTKLFCAFFSQQEFLQVSLTLLSKSKLKRFCEKSLTNTQQKSYLTKCSKLHELHLVN